MAETLQEKTGLWHVILIEKDLVDQAGLREEDFEQNLGFFKYRGLAVVVSHEYNNHLVVSRYGQYCEDLTRLVEGFSNVIGYKPFCAYILKVAHSSLPTYEWDKVNPEQRYEELSHIPNICDLVRL
jgi:hypothetical protein